MKHKIKLEVSNKLNSIAGLIKECALKVYQTQDVSLMQETTLAAITHESLCELIDKEGYTEKVVGLINDFGKAVAQLYSNIINFKLPIVVETELEKTIKHNSTLNKNMLN